MRFAYIDSNGNEVPIPGVDALALRIELGAITDETQLYDAQADEWGPAHSHEIYHTLRRSNESEEGFIAPPPVAPPPVAAPPDTVAETEHVEPLPAPGPDAVAEPEPPPQPTADPVGDEGDGAEDPSFGLTLADLPEPLEGDEGDEGADPDVATADAKRGEPTGADATPEVSGGVGAGDDALDFGGLDLAPPDGDPLDLSASGGQDSDPSISAPNAAAEDDTPSGPEPDGFDFGGMEGSLELEESFEDPLQDEAPMSFGPEGTGQDEGLEIESAMDFGAGGFQMDDADGGLDLEAPMSEFSPESPPSWMDDASEPDDGEVLDFSSAVAEADDDVLLRDRGASKTRPSRPRRRRKSITAPLIGAIALVAVGTGVYAAWPMVAERVAEATRDEPDGPVLPPLAEELVPQMRDAASAALATTFAEARAGGSDGGGLRAPPADWLGGTYLANASRYEEAERFWTEMSASLDAVWAIDVADFDAAFVTEMERRGVAQADADAMRARADSGFVAAAEARDETFRIVQTLVDSAIRLHQFLVANEANIEYVPATAATTDPIMEVDPASPEIADAMENLIGAVARSLGRLGYRDQVTADGLWSVVLDHVQENGIR